MAKALSRFGDWLVGLLPKSWQWKLNPDKTRDGHYPQGNKDPAALVAQWDNTALQAGLGFLASQTTGTATNHNVRQYVTGSGAATATISVVATIGSVADFNQPGSGNNLTNSGTNIGSGTFRLGATVSGNTVLSDPIPWSYIAAAPTDALAPTAGTGLKGTPVTNGINWSWDTAIDPHDGTNLGSGVKEYDLELNGSITVVAGSPGITTAPSFANVGSISNPGAPTGVQGSGANARNWTITAAGTGIDGTSDQLGFVYWQVSGNCRIIAKVNSFTGTGSDYAPGGVMIRESLAVGSKYVACYQWLIAQTKGVEGKYRVNTDGPRANVGYVDGTSSARWVKVERSGDVFTVSYSTDGREWIDIGTQTVSMASTVYVGGFATSMQAGNQVVAALHDLNPSSLARATYSQSTTTATTARVRARDLASSPNVGSYSTLSDSVSPIVNTTPLVRHHPGWYPTLYDKNNTNNTLPSWISHVLTIKNANSNVKGIGFWVTWRFLEPTKNNYSGIPILKSWIDTAWASGLRAMIYVCDRSFDSTRREMPDYLATEAPSGGIYQKTFGGSAPNNGGTMPKIWLAPIGARSTALFTELGAQLDSHPALEAINWGELDPGIFGNEFSAAEFSQSAYVQAIKNTMLAAKNAFPRVNVDAPGNFLPSQTPIAEYVEWCYQNKIGISGPDVYPQDPYRNGGTNKEQTWTDYVIRGYSWNGSAWVSGSFDYRGKIHCANHIQDPDWGRGYSWPPIAFMQYMAASDGMPHSHCMVWPKDYAFSGYSNFPASAQTYWSDPNGYVGSTLEFRTVLMEGGHALWQAAPTMYGGNVDTG